MRKIRCLCSEEITDDVLDTMYKIITQSSYPGDAQGLFCNFEHHSLFHNKEFNQKYIILGEDWFIGYTVSKLTTEFDCWYATTNSKNKFQQSIEMMRLIINILKEQRESEFFCSCRHLTSYPFLLSMCNRGFIKKLNESSFIDYSIPYYEWQEIAKFYDNGVFNENVEKWLCHNVRFKITDKFSKKYVKKNTTSF